MHRVPEIVLGFLVATALWAGIFLFQPQKAVPNYEAQPAKSEQQHAVSGRPAGQQEQHAEGHQKGSWYDTFLNHTPDWFVALFTALLTFVTYRLVSTTGDLRASTDRLWEAGERQIELSRETADAQSRDMRASIGAAREANRIGADALHASQRAWLNEETIADSDLVWNQTGCELIIKTNVKNIGTVPAQDVVVDAKIVAIKRGVRDYTISDAIDEPPSKAMGQLLFPNAEFAPNRKLKLTRQEANDVAVGKEVTIYVVVMVRYRSGPRSARTIRFYDLKKMPDEPGIDYLVPVTIGYNVPKDTLFLNHHWMPSYAD
ncbi:hypothetical protein [Bradyrhizobium sp. 33ap4]|uniref:hypothetical protein n=1 Tax=Bradyrhizobium sp. 33ap4 TaxID=3061630 RepID=UPI002930D562|nr:hypothetical protein [Bradyrhizobium sp. 33ap4]